MNPAEVAELLDNPDCHIESRYLNASDGFQLRVYSFTPNQKSTAPPVVFIPGWTSVMDGWAPLLSAWVGKRTIHYIETREKRSATVPKKLRARDFEMLRHAEDLNEISAELNLDENVLWFGSSLGATVILHGLMEGLLKGNSAFLIAPNSQFRFPTWMVPLTAAPWWCYSPLIRLGLPYLKWRLKEPGQYIRYRRTLTQAHLLRLKKSVQANRRYDLPANLERINAKIAICVAASDTLHTGTDSHGIADALPNGCLVEVPSNQYAHEADVIADIDSWEAA
jgi:pimeloyl-ACP methyl ester carboxylesterase